MEQINPSNTDNMSGAMSRCKQLAMFIALVSFVLVIVCVSAFTGMLNMMGRHAFAMQSLGSIPVVVLGGIATYSLLKRTANAVALAKGFAWILLATSVFESYALITEYEAWMLATLRITIAACAGAMLLSLYKSNFIKDAFPESERRADAWAIVTFVLCSVLFFVIPLAATFFMIF